jgi:hypothetical protein
LRSLISALNESEPENILTPGKASGSPEVQAFLKALEKAFRKHFPDGGFKATAEKKFGHNSIYIATATLPFGSQTNGIVQNDPSYNTFWMHDSYTDEGLAEKISIEMSQGGTLKTNREDQFKRGVSVKVGWRNATASPQSIVGKFDQYFGKLAALVAEQA